VQNWAGPRGCRKLGPTEFLDSRYLKVVRLSAVRTGHLYVTEVTLGTYLCLKVESIARLKELGQ